MAYEFYVTIEGIRQGTFKGESVHESRANKIVGVKFLYEVKSPHDARSGMTTGQPLHGPVIFTKAWGAASPQIFQALVSNETLKTVLFEFFRVSPDGTKELFQTITLMNASISNLRQYIEAASVGGDAPELEDISLTFGQIEIANLPGKSVAVDSWMGGRAG